MHKILSLSVAVIIIMVMAGCGSVTKVSGADDTDRSVVAGDGDVPINGPFIVEDDEEEAVGTGGGGVSGSGNGPAGNYLIEEKTKGAADSKSISIAYFYGLSAGVIDVPYVDPDGEPVEVSIDARNCVGKCSFTLKGLPNGLSFDGETMIVSGTPAEIGAFEVEAVATDSTGKTASMKNTLDIKEVVAIAFRYLKHENGKSVKTGLFNGDVLEGGKDIIVGVSGHQAQYEMDVSFMVNDSEKDIGIVEYGKMAKIPLPESTANEQSVELRVTVSDESGTIDLVTETRTFKIAEDPCKGSFSVEKNGKKLTAKGGKAPYEWEAKSLWRELKKDYVTEIATDSPVPAPSEKISISSTSEDSSKAEIALLENAPKIYNEKINGLFKSYSVKAVIEVVDSCPGRDPVGNTVELVNIDNTDEETLDELKIQCDFIQIANAGNNDPYISLQIKTGSDQKVAEAKYELDKCDYSEGKDYSYKCEKPMSFISMDDEDLANYKLSDITNIRLVAHKQMESASGDTDHLVVDVAWCRLYTERWYAIFDRGLYFMLLDVGGDMSWYLNNNYDSTNVIQHFRNYNADEGANSIWKPMMWINHVDYTHQKPRSVYKNYFKCDGTDTFGDDVNGPYDGETQLICHGDYAGGKVTHLEPADQGP